MKVIGKVGREDIATVYIAENRKGFFTEFVESVQPPIPIGEKWVLIVSTLYGCPVKCKICDAGGFYKGRLTTEEILEQIDFLVQRHFPQKKIPVKKFKIQFARIGEPAFNEAVLEVIEKLKVLYDAEGLIICISTIAPYGTENFFNRMLKIKQKYYQGRFQLQFSIHTTDYKLRDWLIPVKKWDFRKIADYGDLFYEYGDRKISLNFAIGENIDVDEKILLKYFNPEKFLIKITPINPTFSSMKNNINSYIKSENENYEIINRLKKSGYEVILSIGEFEENKIGSNCGQYITNYLKRRTILEDSYTYPIIST